MVYTLSDACSVAVVVAFFICWAPFHTQRLMSAYANSAAAAATDESDANNFTVAITDVDEAEPTQNVGDLVFFYVSGVLYYVSSVINPILYNIMSVKFRQAFVDTILRCSCRGGRRRDRDEFVGRLTLRDSGATAVSVRRFRFVAAGGAGQQSLEQGSSDVGSLRQRNADENGPEDVQPLTSSSPSNGRQVRQLHATDSIVLVDMHYAGRMTRTAHV